MWVGVNIYWARGGMTPTIDESLAPYHMKNPSNLPMRHFMSERTPFASIVNSSDFSGEAWYHTFLIWDVLIPKTIYEYQMHACFTMAQFSILPCPSLPWYQRTADKHRCVAREEPSSYRPSREFAQRAECTLWSIFECSNRSSVLQQGRSVGITFAAIPRRLQTTGNTIHK